MSVKHEKFPRAWSFKGIAKKPGLAPPPLGGGTTSATSRGRLRRSRALWRGSAAGPKAAGRKPKFSRPKGAGGFYIYIYIYIYIFRGESLAANDQPRETSSLPLPGLSSIENGHVYSVSPVSFKEDRSLFNKGCDSFSF